MPHIYEGFRLIMEDVLKCLADALQQFGGPLRAKAIRAIMEEKRKAPIPGCPRTFTRGLVRVLAETGLGERVGRRFQLHLADWQRVIAMLRANYTPKVSTTGRASPPAPSHRDSTAPSSMPSSSRAGAGICPVNCLATAAHQHGRTPCGRPGRTPRGRPAPGHAMILDWSSRSSAAGVGRSGGTAARRTTNGSTIERTTTARADSRV
jgi:hypothetical protein